MKVWIPQPLLSYTNRASQVEAQGATLAELVADLDRQFPGLGFRIVDEQDRLRPHVKFFVNGTQAVRLDAPVAPGDEVHLLQSLSGG